MFRLTACWRGAILLACLTVAEAALSEQTIEAARMAYDQGRFTEAAELAESLDTSAGLALAAKSLATFGYHIAEDDHKLALFDRAALLAEESTRLDTDNPDAWVQLAHAKGRYAQAIGIFEAAGKGYATIVRDALEEALRLDPQNADAHVSLATWHAEALSSGGFMARALYGASKKSALKHYEEAIRLAPGEKLIYVQYALGLLLLNETRNRRRAREFLVQAIGISPRDAQDRLFHQMAVERLQSLESGKTRGDSTRTHK